MKAHLLLLPAACLLFGADAPRDARPAHLVWAQKMVHNVSADRTHYQHKESEVRWEEPYVCKTDCSGFRNAVLQRAYGRTGHDFEEWFQKKRPLAADYCDAIQKEKKFKRIDIIAESRPGEVLAVRYPPGDPENKDHNSGHVMLLVSKPAPRHPTEPLIAGTRQWEVEIIDQSHSGHGPKDTRNQAKERDDRSGVGQGVLRLYANPDGTVAGYTWSTSKKSAYRDQTRRHLAIGRLDAARKP